VQQVVGFATIFGMAAKKGKSTSSSEVKAKFAVRLKAVRMSAGYRTKISFARKLGVEGETYNRWERGETEPGIAELAKIHEITGASLDMLIAGDFRRVREEGSEDARPLRKDRRAHPSP
jgi:transcriptional regulator with XRE-family HTH domain